MLEHVVLEPGGGVEALPAGVAGEGPLARMQRARVVVQRTLALKHLVAHHAQILVGAVVELLVE